MRSDEYYMHRALDQAHLAFGAGEVPVGAVVINAAGEVIAAAHNAPLAEHDPCAHAEVQALRAGGERWAITGSTAARFT